MARVACALMAGVALAMLSFPVIVLIIIYVYANPH